MPICIHQMASLTIIYKTILDNLMTVHSLRTMVLMEEGCSSKAHRNNSKMVSMAAYFINNIHSQRTHSYPEIHHQQQMGDHVQMHGKAHFHQMQCMIHLAIHSLHFNIIKRVKHNNILPSTMWEEFSEGAIGFNTLLYTKSY